MTDTSRSHQATPQAPKLTYHDDRHEYFIDGEKVPSVTTFLDAVTPKDALTWWGMRAGLAAVIKLMQADKISWPILAAHVYEEVLSPKSFEVFRSPTQQAGRGKTRTLVEHLVVTEKLSTNHIRDKAADRGTEIHEAVQLVGIEGRIPNLDDFPEDFRGALRAFSKWWLDHDPEFIEQEVIVGHRELRFAGRFDLKARLSGVKTLIDFKTSGAIYNNYFEQLRAYDMGDRYMGQWENGFEPCDQLAVVHLDRSGEYEMAFGDHVSPDTVAAALSLYHSRAADAARKASGQIAMPV